jgi:tetratricopeptide (TPR) repeat protein
LIRDGRLPAGPIGSPITSVLNDSVLDLPQMRSSEPILIPTVETPVVAETEQPSEVFSRRVKDTSVLPRYDVFADIRMALALADGSDDQWFEDLRAGAQGNPSAQGDENLAATESAEDFQRRLMEVPIETFRGEGKTNFNDTILKAEALMELRHYHEAARRYAFAASLAPANPLPLFGQANAQIASGDYLSAAGSLIKAYERFPDIVRYKFNLKRLMGGEDVVDIRRSELETMINRYDTAELRLVLGYIEINSGRADNGMAHLHKAAELDRLKTIISRLPAMMRGEAPMPPPKPGAASTDNR